MRSIPVGLNRACFCNSGKKFKECCGFGAREEVVDSFKVHFVLRDVFSRLGSFVFQNYDSKKLLEEFKIYYNVPKEDGVDDEKHKLSFRFMEFLIFNAKVDSGKLVDRVLKNGLFSGFEREFFSDLVKNSHFGIFKVLKVDTKEFFVELENIFSKDRFSFYDKIISTNLSEGGLVYGKKYTVIGRSGILPTFNFKAPEHVKDDDIEKSSEAFNKRFEESEIKFDSFDEFMDSIEFEIYGGDDPYHVYEFEERLEKFKRENPDKDIDEFLDEVEDEILGLHDK